MQTMINMQMSVLQIYKKQNETESFRWGIIYVSKIIVEWQRWLWYTSGGIDVVTALNCNKFLFLNYVHLSELLHPSCSVALLCM